MKSFFPLLFCLFISVGYSQDSKPAVKAEIQTKTLALVLNIERDAVEYMQKAFEEFYAAGFDSTTNLRTVEDENRIAFLNAQLKLSDAMYQNLPPKAFQEWSGLRNEQLMNRINTSSYNPIYTSEPHRTIEEAQQKRLPIELTAY